MVIFSLLKKTFPFEDFKFPAIRLNSVVFPDPFGPIIPVIVPLLMVNEQSDTAASPPKYFEIFSIFRIFKSDDLENYILLSLLRILFNVFSVDL